MAGPQYTHTQLEELWVLAGGPQRYADTAAAVAEAESGGCQYAKAGPSDDRPQKECTYRFTTFENSYGLWQINRRAHPHYSAASLYDALGNAEAAVAVSSHGTNWTPWTKYKTGAYKQYLTGGTSSTGAPSAPSLARSGSGWASINKALSRSLPKSLTDAAHLRRAALDRLRH